MKIEIDWVTIRTARTIKVEGVSYPRTQHNLNVVKEYDETQNELILGRLVDFSLEL